MKAFRVSAILILGLCLSLLLGACGASSTGNQGTPQPTTAQATAKPKPTSAPPVTKEFCESVMTVDDANQIMNPPAPVTKIVTQSDNELGVCSYISSQAQFAVVKILIEEKPYTGPKPVPDATIVQLVKQLADEPGVTVSKTTPVSGVGDQAEFLDASVSSGNITLYADVIYVIYGNVAFLCDDFHLNSKPDDTAQQNALTQCAQRVVNHL